MRLFYVADLTAHELGAAAHDGRLPLIGVAYLKNLFVCYMTIPAFLIANALGSIIAENIMHMCGQNKYTMLGLLFAFVFKLFLFAKSVKFCRELF